MFCVSSGRAGMCFAPTTSHPHYPRPHQRDLPENQYSYRPPPQPSPASHPCPTYFPRYAPPFAILECRFPFWVRSFSPYLPLARPARFSFCHSNPQACILPSRRSHPPVLFRSSFAGLSLDSFHPTPRRPPTCHEAPVVFFRAPAADSANQSNHPYWLNDPLKRLDTQASIKMR